MVPRLSASIEAQKNTVFHSGTGIFGYREETAMQTDSDLQLDDSPEERRRHLHLRVLYDDASNRIEQFFRHRNEWAGSSINYLAQRIIHEDAPWVPLWHSDFTVVARREIGGLTIHPGALIYYRTVRHVR